MHRQHKATIGVEEKPKKTKQKTEYVDPIIFEEDLLMWNSGICL